MLMHLQGLLDDCERPASHQSLQQLIERMGFVQIDTINVIERAHHLTLFSRMHNYRHGMLAHLLEHDRALFEHWTHDASAIPLQWFAHWQHRFARYRQRIPENRWWSQRIGAQPQRTVDQVLERITAEGPLQSRDFEHDRAGHPLPEDGWWGWKPQKAALEYLWRCGELAVARRINFQKVYDLTRRVYPDHHAAPAPDRDEHVDWACRSALQRLGVATPAEIAAFWHAITLAEARQWCQHAVQRREIEPVLVESADNSRPRPSFALRDWQQRVREMPDPDMLGDRVRLLSPFDPVLRDRKRTLRLFKFDYSFEAFTPGPKRKYGYYVLPMLEQDRLVGRLDAKFQRDRAVLQVNGVWWERGIKPTRTRQRALKDALERLARFIGANDVAMPR